MAPASIAIELNGEVRHFPAPVTVQMLIESLALPAAGLAVAVNRQVVPRNSWADHALQTNDRIDIVRAIGGG